MRIDITAIIPLSLQIRKFPTTDDLLDPQKRIPDCRLYDRNLSQHSATVKMLGKILLQATLTVFVGAYAHQIPYGFHLLPSLYTQSSFQAPPTFHAPPNTFQAPPTFHASHNTFQAPPTFHAPPNTFKAPPTFHASPNTFQAPPTFHASPNTFQAPPTFQVLPTFQAPSPFLATPPFPVSLTADVQSSVRSPSHYQKVYSNPWQFLTPVSRSEAPELPCSTDGFYVHPTNCSMFYRCVDYAGTGINFLRYLFSCPTGHIFADDVSICIPGECDGDSETPAPGETSTEAPATVEPAAPTETLLPGPVEPSTDKPVEPVVPESVEPVTDAPAPEEPSTNTPVQPAVPDVTEPSTDAPVEPSVGTPAPEEPLVPDVPEPSTSTPVEPTIPEATEPSTVFPMEQTTAPPMPVEPSAGNQECMGQYIQHPEYCNVYYRCDDEKTLYICPAGTAFDQSRQMCRITAHDEGVCAGLALMPTLLRMALHNGHLVLLSPPFPL
ncbi:extensin-like [Penaeus japonicus]|uniref:extensin-like n=1 Tax=Penaeus japonicus TaxID=27405 RepID=UPI001C70D128|nr:extensin-like [Penaeus japonicus]